MGKVFIISSYLFDKYILRYNCKDNYVNTPCYGKTYEDIKDYVCQVLDGFYSDIPVRYYVDWGLRDSSIFGIFVCPDSGISFNNLHSRTIIVEDCKLAKFEAYYWKDYVYKKGGRK